MHVCTLYTANLNGSCTLFADHQMTPLNSKMVTQLVRPWHNRISCVIRTQRYPPTTNKLEVTKFQAIWVEATPCLYCTVTTLSSGSFHSLLSCTQPLKVVIAINRCSFVLMRIFWILLMTKTVLSNPSVIGYESRMQKLKWNLSVFNSCELTIVGQESQLRLCTFSSCMYVISCDLMLCVRIRVTTYMYNYKLLAVQHGKQMDSW